MKFIEDFCEAFVSKKDILGYKISYLFANTTIYIIPMVNPDGVDFVTNFFPVNSKIYRNFQYIARNFSSIPFPNGWKANFNGVDLNLQFPANWEMAKKIKYSQGFSKPAPRDFPGYRSFNRARKFSNI
ncbi:MAG: hypothetical protein HUJ68_05080, partial [Clostridia bacterium]|nr:hypothetical protein [Clostridia bacterium]